HHEMANHLVGPPGRFEQFLRQSFVPDGAGLEVGYGDVLYPPRLLCGIAEATAAVVGHVAALTTNRTETFLAHEMHSLLILALNAGETVSSPAEGPVSSCVSHTGRPDSRIQHRGQRR